MAVDEEYLDGLLKSMTGNEQDESTGEDLALDLQNLLGDTEDAISEDTQGSSEEALSLDDDWKFSLDDILAQADAESEEEKSDSLLDLSNWENEEQSAETANEETNPSASDNMDVSDLLASIGDADPDLAEISGMLKDEEQKEAVDAGMLALLEGIDDVQMDGGYEDSDSVFDIFSESASGESTTDGDEPPKASGKDKNKEKRSKKEKKEKKERKKTKLFGGRKQKEEAAASADTEETTPDIVHVKDLLPEEPKEGFFTKVLTYLTQTDEEDEEEQAESKETPEGAEENKKASKKEKKKKKESKKKQKGKEKASEEGAEEEGEEEAEGKAKSKKKPKKEKKEKPPKEKIKEPRVLSTKKLLVLIAFCATIIAGILVLSNFLPEHADKQRARSAFYEGDYETAYKLLYEKKLGSDDEVIFNRAKVVLRLERKLQSYQNNITLQREMEAVDALIQGINCYHELTASDVYGAREELDALYQQICSVLESNYGISPEEAMEINAYDNETYTRKLNSVVNGTEFHVPGTESELTEPPEPLDVLPEEENIIQY